MKKLILFLLVLTSNQQIATAQIDSILNRRYTEFITLENERILTEDKLIDSFYLYYQQKCTGKEVAENYIEFAKETIEMWKIPLKDPEVLFTRMTTMEIVEFIKANTVPGSSSDKQMEDLEHRIRIKIMMHINELSKNIAELSSS
ncbi:MAG: hypothetical protein R3B55_01290 [Candidatus Paceibacterota bacterium]